MYDCSSDLCIFVEIRTCGVWLEQAGVQTGVDSKEWIRSDPQSDSTFTCVYLVFTLSSFALSRSLTPALYLARSFSTPPFYSGCSLSLLLAFHLSLTLIFSLS